MQNKLPVSVLILAQNEETNLPFALESVRNDFDQIIVADSFSTDKTLSICRNYPEVEVYQHVFEHWADQRNWMLGNCKIRNEIVFFLDADEYINKQFVEELRKIIDSGRDFKGIALPNQFIYLNSNLKYAYGHPCKRRIFKKAGLLFKGEGAREYDNVTGEIIFMRNPLIHRDRNPISNWIHKHNNNSDREVELYLKRRGGQGSDPKYKDIASRTRLKWLIRDSIWNKLPLLVRPVSYFVYRYIFGLGFLDKLTGLIYCYLHAFWYHTLIDIKIIEKMSGRENAAPDRAFDDVRRSLMPVTVLIMTERGQTR